MSRRITLAIVAIVIVIGACAAAYLLSRKPAPSRDAVSTSQPAAARDEVIQTFYVAVAALDVDDVDRARAKLTQLTQLAPDEPAGWADLGLLELRLGQLDEAATHLHKAQTLAPSDARIESLLGLLETRRGNFTQAASHLRRAIDLDPKAFRPRYALISVLQRQTGADSDAESLRQLQELRKLAPENLVVLLDLLRLAAIQNDRARIDDLLQRLAPLAENWHKDVQDQFASLQSALKVGNAQQAATQVAFLRNVLAPLPAFRADRAAVEAPPQRVGDPIEKMLTIAAPEPRVAEPDLQLKYVTSSTAPSADVQTAIYLDGDARPSLVRVNHDEISVGGKPLPTRFAPARINGILAVDLDQDFRSDLVLAGAAGIRLLKQTDSARFEDITFRAVSDPSVRDANCVGVWAADSDQDGDLDLVVGVKDQPPIVLQNNGDGTFDVARPFSGIQSVVSFVWADFDDDGDNDAAMLDDAGKLHIFSNDRAGKFIELPLPPELTTRRIWAITTAELGEAKLDLVTLAADGALLQLSQQQDGSAWSIKTAVHWSGAPAQLQPADSILIAADLDNNGRVDFLASCPGGSTIWLADAAGELGPLSTAPSGQVFAVADMNGDGLLDLVGATVANASSNKKYHWQDIRARSKNSKGDSRINSFGIGGKIDLRTGLLVQTRPIDSPMVHFGLGTFSTVDVARVTWPNGTAQAEFDLKADQTVVAEQRLKGSCPSLFAWDGTQMRFVKDCAPWSPALGLAINAQKTADIHQTREWQKIPGEMLKPRDGVYDLRITAELWETYYIDYYAMIVVDHAPGTEVWVDERFSIPPPKLDLYLTQTPHAFARATDDTGTDVTSTLASLDNIYLDTFGRGQYQGVTRDHFVELDLPGDAPRDRPIYLLAHGWLHPTDASVNIAISQGKHEPPRPLSFEVADGKGGWKVVAPSLGFPAGKLKTMVIDLSDSFIDGAPRKLRLRTNMEIYWDQLQWAVGVNADGSNLHRSVLSPTKAELRHRGFSRMTQANASSPEMPRYDQIVSTGQRWRDLIGYYTRYGDITNLLRDADDRMVIVNAGDEMRFEFQPPKVQPQGWKRDFMWIGDGWIKDGDLNSRYSKTVIPLATHETTEYTRPPTTLADEPAYQRHPEDWVSYHTRYVAPDDFRAALRPRTAVKD
jgi:Flp pilus assembly protein TadD